MQLAKIIIVTFHRGPQHFTLMLAKSKGKIKYHSLLANFLQKKNHAKLLALVIMPRILWNLEKKMCMYLVWVVRKRNDRIDLVVGIDIFPRTSIKNNSQRARKFKKVQEKKLVKSNKSNFFSVKLHYWLF